MGKQRHGEGKSESVIQVGGWKGSNSRPGPLPVHSGFLPSHHLLNTYCVPGHGSEDACTTAQGLIFRARAIDRTLETFCPMLIPFAEGRYKEGPPGGAHRPHAP